ncbi:MAG: hypothetical protein EOP60_05740 [Sphingomonadales bacterium]|nr:MAG: hypothetical protein EOP60_05740 [Sphingomonadales bacterium]
MYQTDPAASMAASSSAPQVSLAVVDAASGKPAIQTGVTTTLSVTLTNGGGALALVTAPKPSTLTIYLPEYISAAALAAMQIALTDWTFAAGADALTLTYAGAETGEWIGNLAFQITGVLAQGAPTDGTFQVSFAGIQGTPKQITTPLPLIAQPQPGNASLADVLQVSLDSRGAVYVSGSAYDPLANTLFLNIKNIGSTPLYTGTVAPTGAEIAVSFTYGNTSGAIAPAESTKPTTPPLGSAWNIEGGIYVDQTMGWRVSPARSDDPQPIWRLTPQPTNTNLIGVGANSNVTFDFSEIISMTAIGHTQMTLNFRGFKRTDGQAYDPLILLLDIVKQPPPANRGLLSFFGTETPIILVPDQKTPVDIPLRWSMAQVNQVQIFSSFPGVTSDFEGLAPGSQVYAAAPATPLPLAADKATIRIPSTTQSSAVTLTIQARDGQGAYLNAMQYTCYLQMQVFVDPRDNQIYPIALINNKYWMTKNLNYADQNSFIYNNISSNAATYGRLYPSNSSSVLAPPAGWHVPSLDDWSALFASFGSPSAAYAALTATSARSFAAQLGGKYAASQYNDLLVTGYYQIAGNPTFASINSQSRTVAVAGSLPAGSAFSVRYVRDL